MTLEYNHQCNDCENQLTNDDCWCEKCRDSYVSDAYEAGKKDGYDEGYAAAEKELTKDE